MQVGIFERRGHMDVSTLLLVVFLAVRLDVGEAYRWTTDQYAQAKDEHPQRR
jgi:hypothetical protein